MEATVNLRESQNSHCSHAIKLDFLPYPGPLGLLSTSSCQGPRVANDGQAGSYTWRYGKMQFQSNPWTDPLPAHQPSLRLLKSEVYGSRGSDSNPSDAVKIFEENGRSLSSCIHSAVYRPVNMEEYLTHGLSIVSRLPDVSKETTQFVPEVYARFLGREAFGAIIDLGEVYCGEGIREILSVVFGETDAVERCIDSATKSQVGRVICVKLTDLCRKVAAEHDAMASTMSLDEASDYLFTRFTGKERIISLTKLLLRTGRLLAEDRRNLHVVKRGLNSSMRSFSFLWNDSVAEARHLLDTAKQMICSVVQTQELQRVDFWALVDRLSHMVSRPRISLDAVVAVALAELGVVLNCDSVCTNVLRAIAGENATMTTTPVSLTNPGSVWISPFRALTANRVVLALDGRTRLLMIDELSGVKHTCGVYQKCNSKETHFICCEPLPYTHIKTVKMTMPKAFAALARDGQPWNDGLQKELQRLSAGKVPSDGVEVDRVVTKAKECYLRVNVLAAEYAEVIFSVKRIISVFTLAVEQGRRMGDVLYQYSLMMVHPDASKISERRVREVWDKTDEVPEELRRFIENVRLTYEGWMVYPESGSARVRQVRRRYTHVNTVWLGAHERR